MDNQPFQLLAQKVQSLDYTDMINSLVYPNTYSPMRSINIKYKVSALSKDLIEGVAGNVIEAKDNQRPSTAYDTTQIISAVSDPQGDTTLYTISLRYDEPLNPVDASSIDSYNFQTISGFTFTKTKVVYLDYYNGYYQVQVTFTTNKMLKPTNIFRITSPNIKDLAGNLITNKNIFKCKGPN